MKYQQINNKIAEVKFHEKSQDSNWIMPSTIKKKEH